MNHGLRIHTPPPRPKHAELTITSLGKHPDLTVETLRAAGEIEGRQFRRLRAGTLPLTITLPGVYYDLDSPLVRLLHDDGAVFKIEVYSWVCPTEMRDDQHWCTGACASVQIMEIVR